jgi:hypothetical protein
MLPGPGALFTILAANGDRTLIASAGLLLPVSLTL